MVKDFAEGGLHNGGYWIGIGERTLMSITAATFVGFAINYLLERLP